MRLSVFSDIHGNLEALDAYIQETAGQSVDRHICLGDIVGYGANPNECMERLAALPDLHIVLGNHDATAIWQASPYEMNPNARKAILWTIEQLSQVHIDRIHRLDEMLQIGDMVFCHANPYNPAGWRYVANWYNAVRSFFSSRGRLTFVGHTHQPKVITQSNGYKIKLTDPPADGCLSLSVQKRYIINCGAIGQPRDGNPDAAYTIYDTDKETVEFKRFTYDIEGAARRIGAAGLPAYLADRLFRGR